MNAVKRHVAAMIGQQGQTRIGTIVSVNADTYQARVMLQPENVQSGWLPVAAAMVGGGWGIVSPPTVGEQVVIEPQEGDAEHGIITGRVFSTKQQPPKTYTDQYDQGSTTSAQPGEFAIVNSDGTTFIRVVGGKVLIHGDLYVDGIIRATKDIKSDMNVLATLNVEATVDVTAGQNITAGQNMKATADIAAGGNVADVHGSLDKHRRIYNSHTHPSNGFPVFQDPE